MATDIVSTPEQSSRPIGPVTIDEFRRIAAESEHPVELIDGEVVEMSGPTIRHGVICTLIASLLMTWARETGAGIAGVDGGLLIDEQGRTTLFPDVFFIAADQLENGTAPDGYLRTAPPLCVEVVSDSETWRLIQDKLRRYFAFGVKEVWLVDPELKSVVAFSSPDSSRSLTSEDTIETSTLPGFSCCVSDFFHGC